VVIDRIVATTKIFEAWSDEEWTIDGADVRVSIICFGASSQETRCHLVSVINADLSASQANLTTARRLIENAHVAFQGPVKVGPFDISGELTRDWLAEPTNPNGQPNSVVLFPWINGSDVVRRPSGKWIIDFGEMNQSEAQFFERPFEYARQDVFPFRATNRRARRRDLWWQHGETVPSLKKAVRALARHIVTPRVSKHRVFIWSHHMVLPDSRLVAIASQQDEIFGVVHSRFHEAWSLRLGGWHGVGNDPQYTPTLGFETFPFPEGLTPNIPAKDYENDPRAIAIAKAAKRLDELRNTWLNPPDLIDVVPEVVPGYPNRILPKNEKAAAELKKRTLTNLYNARPQWLDDAHRDLDAAVAAAYGWPADIAEDDALARLLELNLARASAGAARAGEKEDDGED
jgi:type II restriction/modification system DNA methylase subunit YeeA